MTVFLQRGQLILLVCDIVVIETACKNQTDSGWKGPWEVSESNLWEAATVLSYDLAARGFSHCILKISKDGDCQTSLGNLLHCSAIPMMNWGAAARNPEANSSPGLTSPASHREVLWLPWWASIATGPVSQYVSCPGGEKTGCSVLEVL